MPTPAIRWSTGMPPDLRDALEEAGLAEVAIQEETQEVETARQRRHPRALV